MNYYEYSNKLGLFWLFSYLEHAYFTNNVVHTYDLNQLEKWKYIGRFRTITTINISS